MKATPGDILLTTTVPLMLVMKSAAGWVQEGLQSQLSLRLRHTVALANQAAVSTRGCASTQNIEEESCLQEAGGFLQSSHGCVLQTHELGLPRLLSLAQKGTRKLNENISSTSLQSLISRPEPGLFEQPTCGSWLDID